MTQLAQAALSSTDDLPDVPPHSGPVPRALRYVSIAGLVVGVVMIFVGGLRVGVTWDEPIHVERFNNYLETGWYLGEGQLENGQPVSTMTQQYVYAPATMLLLHGLGVVTGVEHPGAASSTADAYAVRHVGIGLIGVLGILCVAGLGRVLLRRWDWALVAGATIAVMPMWTGYSMFNIKDVSVGTGYTMATLGLTVIARHARGSGWQVWLAGPGAVAAGILLAVGTRPGIWTGIAAGTAVLVGCLLIRPGSGSLLHRLRLDAWRYRDLLTGYALGGIGLYAIDPKVFSSPIHALVRAAFSSANFLGSHSPRTFVPVGVFLQVPVLMLAFTFIGVWVSARRMVHVRLLPGVFETRLLLVLAQVFTLPLLAIIHSATLYGDLRQLLFAAPATAVVATLGIQRVVAAARAGADRRGPRMVSAVACLALLAPLVDQATLFPYNYTYFNPFASVAKVQLMGDYYRASGRELVPDLPVSGRIVCSANGDPDGNAMRMAHLDGWVDCRTAQMSPISPYLRRGDGLDLPPLKHDEFWDVSFGSSDEPNNCEAVSTVTRRFRWTKLRMARLYRCTRPFPVLSTASQRMASDSLRGLSFFDQGWLIPLTDGTPVGVLSRDHGPGSMTFRLARQFMGHDVRLVLESARPAALPVVTFGGSPVEVTANDSDPGLTISIPRTLADRATREPLTLELRPRASEALDIKVLSMRAMVGNRL